VAILGTVHRNALKYIINTGGSIHVEYFIDDNAPIGPELLVDLLQADLVYQDSKLEIHLTERGKKMLNEESAVQK
jgi:hypothetical protein